MKRMGVVAVVLAAIVSPAMATIVNGTFDDGLNGWTAGGGANILAGNPFGMPTSPSGDPSAGVISSWGGDWGAPLGAISQTVTGVTGSQMLSGEIFAAAHAGDVWRNVLVEVLWDGATVASLARDADAVRYAQDFPWVSFAVPVVGTGNDLLEVKYTVHFAEWSWLGADNLQVTPEPATLLLLVAGIATLRRRR